MLINYSMGYFIFVILTCEILAYEILKGQKVDPVVGDAILQ